MKDALTLYNQKSGRAIPMATQSMKIIHNFIAKLARKMSVCVCECARGFFTRS